MRVQRHTQRLLQTGNGLVQIQPRGNFAVAGAGIFVLPREHEEVRGFAGLEKARLAVELIFGGTGAGLGRSDPLSRGLNGLQGVADLGFNSLLHLCLLQITGTKVQVKE